MARLDKLKDVVDWRLCLGCGACAYICPDQKVRLIDYPEEGIRPFVAKTDCGSCRQCLEVCPAVKSDFSDRGSSGASRSTNSFVEEWGRVVAIWEGHASDEEIRFKGSSGGVLTALGAYCVEVLGMSGVLHIAEDPGDPVRNRTRLSRTREEMLAAAGSRYSPASVCDGLGIVENSAAPCAIIGKPSEIAAVCNARQMRPELDEKVGVTVSFFCAETPSTNGTLALLKELEIAPATLRNLRYRGFGWPGHFAPTCEGEADPRDKITYRKSWAFLQAFRPWSVQFWPDGSGELADISCGDPWYEEPDGRNPGFSLVVARTERGRQIVQGAMEAGYLTLELAENWKLAKSQSGLLAKKGAIYGRRWAMRLLGLPVTKLEGLDLRHCWSQIPLTGKLRATLGTIRRVVSRRIYRRLKLDSKGSRSVGEPIGSASTPVDTARDSRN